MKYILWILPVFLLFAPSIQVRGQHKTVNVCYISNERIYFNLDRRWSESQKQEFSVLFSLDSALIEYALKTNTDFVYNQIPWQVKTLNETHIEISRSMSNGHSPYIKNDVVLREDNPVWPDPPVISWEKYGVNKFKDESAFRYENDTAWFSLHGFKNSRQIYLSGSFNNWSTRQLPMTRTDNGWKIGIKLKPGKYHYKYIVDGKWITDPANIQRESNSMDGYNSVINCYNHTFELKGFPKAKKVYLTGSFVNWDKNRIKMNRKGDGWMAKIYLPEGTHFYKFIVDGQWMTDSHNPNVKLDAHGNANSFVSKGDTLLFTLKGYDAAQNVILTGNFNNWSHNELKMNKTSTGWELPYVLGAGNYEYKFIVDGTWITDPANPYTVGTGNFTNSCITFKPNHTFTLLNYPGAESVIVTGSFNNWDNQGYKMEKTNGVWTYSLYLKPGKYTYKYIIDGAWLIDPANEYWEDNALGTGNSVLWIEP